MSFNFFQISKDLHNAFKGIAGSEDDIDLYLCVKTYTEGDPRPTKTMNHIVVNGLLTNLTKTSTDYQTYIANGRTGICLRILDKATILDKVNIDNLLTQESYFVWKQERYSICAWTDNLNNNQIRIYAYYGGIS